MGIEEHSPKRDVIRVTNPDYCLYLFPLLKEFIAALQPVGIAEETMAALVLTNLNRSYFRLYVARKDNVPIGFMVLQEAGPPYYATLDVIAVYMREDGGYYARKFRDAINQTKRECGAKYLGFCGMNKEMAPKFAKFLGLEEAGAYYIGIGKEN